VSGWLQVSSNGWERGLGMDRKLDRESRRLFALATARLGRLGYTFCIRGCEVFGIL